MDHLNIDDVVLVLHDCGGALGLDWASRNEDRVVGLALMETRIAAYPTWEDVPPFARDRFQRPQPRRRLADDDRGHFVPDEHGHVVAAHLTGWLQSH